ncbi:10570_t:CDS:2, partial [Dentiscutata heterogama]
ICDNKVHRDSGHLDSGFLCHTYQTQACHKSVLNPSLFQLGSDHSPTITSKAGLPETQTTSILQYFQDLEKSTS